MSEHTNKQRIEAALPLILLIGLVLLTIEVLLPFAPAIIWGVILSVSFSPMHERLTARFGGRPKLAANLIAVLLAVTMILPMIFLSRTLLAFIPDAIAWATALHAYVPIEGAVPAQGSEGNLEETGPLWNMLLTDLQYVVTHFGAELRPVAFWLVGEGRLIGVFVVEFALGVLIAILLLHNSKRVGRGVLEAVTRVGGPFAGNLVQNALVTIRATVFGVLGSAAAQTVVASVAYVIVDAPYWQVLALLTFLLGLIQIGPILVWVPLCIWLWSGDQHGMAIFMGLWGAIVVGLTDNIVKTLVVSRGTGLPAILAFLGALGGLLTWGIVGLFVGPVIVAVSYRILQTWMAPEEQVLESSSGTQP